MDIDPNTFNMCVQKLKVKLEEAEKTGTLPKVVVPVHFGGLSCEMDETSLFIPTYLNDMYRVSLAPPVEGEEPQSLTWSQVDPAGDVSKVGEWGAV